jgi:hypothetical protein
MQRSILTVLDEYMRECIAIHVARSLSSQQVIQLLEWLFLLRGATSYLRSDNGPELIAFALQQWLHDRHCNMTDTARRTTSHQAARGRILSSSASTAPYEPKCSISGSLPMGRKRRRSSNNGDRSTITTAQTAASVIYRQLSLQSRLDSHCYWSDLCHWSSPGGGTPARRPIHSRPSVTSPQPSLALTRYLDAGAPILIRA